MSGSLAVYGVSYLISLTILCPLLSFVLSLYFFFSASLFKSNAIGCIAYLYGVNKKRILALSIQQMNLKTKNKKEYYNKN